MIVAAFVFAAIAAVLLFVTLRSGDGDGAATIAPVAMADVVVATQDISGNTKLTEGMIEIKSLPEDQLLAGVYTAIEAAVGLPVRYPLQAGEQVTASKVGLQAIADEKDLALVLDAGMRAFALSASEVTAVGGLLLPKNFVDVVAVFQTDEGHIEAAVHALVEQQNIVAEGAGAAGVAALMKEPERFAGRKVGAVICGGNIDVRLLSWVLTRGLVRDGRMVRLRIGIVDRPGVLAQVAQLIGATGGNIIEVYHQRLFYDVPAKQADVDAVIETRNPEHVREIVAALEAGGFPTRVLSARSDEGQAPGAP